MAGKSGGTATVLVVDDDVYGLTFFKSCLKMLGFEVLTTTSVDEAQAIVEERGIADIHCILTDFRMPGKTGLDLLRWVQERDPDLSTVMITAEGEMGVVQDSLRGGAVDFLEKPVGYQTLQQVIEKAVTNTSKSRQMSETSEAVRSASDLGVIFHSVVDPRAAERLKYYFRPKHEVGGDFMNVLHPDSNRLVLVAGDVSGHNVRAGFVSAFFQGMLRGLVQEKKDCLQKVITTFDRILSAEWNKDADLAEGGLPISLSLNAVEIDLAENKVLFINAGGPPSHWVTAAGTVSASESRNAPLGWNSNDSLSVSTASFGSQGCLYLWSDGVSDYAEQLDIDSFALVYRLLGSGGHPTPFGSEPPPDDILAMRFQINDEEAKDSFQPLIFEQYAGDEYEDIDRLQDIWRKSLRFAIKPLPDQRIYDFLVCCREAVLNAMVHGCDRSSGKICTFQVAFNEERGVLRARIDDPGTGHRFDVEERVRQLGSFEGGHLGLSLIHDLSDVTRIENSGASLIFEFHSNPTT